MRVVVDGEEREVAEGLTVLRALTSIGIPVPSLCDDDRLAPYGECRMCLVRVDGNPQPVAACVTPVRPGMAVETAPEDIEVSRREILRMLVRHYPAGAVTGEPDKPLHQLLAQYAVGDAPAEPGSPARRDESHPCITVDMNRCIECYRCVRICDEVQGQFAWQITGRGHGTRVVPSGAQTLLESPCVSCGACVDTCPTGALEDRTVVEFGTPTSWTRTTCPYCGVGCELLVGTRDDRIVTAVPAIDAPVNHGHACVKGHYGHGFVHATDRVTSPMIRNAGKWQNVSWDVAIDTVARGFEHTIDAHGSAAVGVLASARATNEENYLLQKFARTVLETNNIDCCARVCHAPSAVALKQAFGTGAATNSFDDIELANTILLCGANATENHPVVGARIKQAARHGAALIVVDPRRIELAEYAQVHLRPRPGTNVLLFNAMAHVIIEEGLANDAFIAARVDGLEGYTREIEGYEPERVAARCGVDADDIRRAARIYATRTPSIAFHGLGMTEHTQGTDGVTCIANLALLTGNVGKPGTGVNPLRGQNNVQGAAHMGCEPDYLPGFAPRTDAERFELVWGAPLPHADGLDAMEMLDAAAAGGIRALWVVGWDILQTQPNMTTTEHALASLDLLVVQDLFLDETARVYGTVFLPACSAFEKDGTFMNAERRVQRVRRALRPVGDTRSDWEIVCDVADAMGSGELFQYDSAEQIWDEVRRVWPVGAGISYARLEQPGGLQWPCPTEDHPGTPMLHAHTFGTRGSRTELRPIAHQPSPEVVTSDYPFVLVTGRVLERFNAGTMTARSLTQHLAPNDLLEISPEDAKQLGVRDGELVHVRSRHGETELAARVTDRVAPGQLFATFSDATAAVNRVTSPHRDPTTNTPEYKLTAVRLHKVADA